MPEFDEANVTKVIVGELVAAAKNSPDMSTAGQRTAETLKILATTVRNVLLPLAAFNYGMERARQYFTERFAEDMEVKVADIPPDALVPPKAYIVGPALQGLAYTHEEAPLKDMYLNLLTNSMDVRQNGVVHPAHVEVLKQLTTEEVEILNTLLKSDGPRCIAQIHLHVAPPEFGYSVPYQHLMNLMKDDAPYVNPRFPAMITNWIRLGLLSVTYSQTLQSPDGYDMLEKRPEVEALRARYESTGQTVTLNRGAVQRTEFGREFAVAVGVNAGVLP